MSSQTPLPRANNRIPVVPVPKCDWLKLKQGTAHVYSPTEWHRAVFGKVSEPLQPRQCDRCMTLENEPGGHDVCPLGGDHVFVTQFTAGVKIDVADFMRP